MTTSVNVVVLTLRLLLLATLNIVCFLPPVCDASKPPNIIFVVADDLGWNDVGWRNKDIITPNLDRYAHSGVILNNSYVQPVCTPSRTSFMTGYYPYHTGMQHYVIEPSQPKYVPANFTFLPQLLKKVGYKTHVVGKWHLGFCNWKYTPTYRGFDSFLGYYNGAEDYYTRMKHDQKLDYNGFDFHFNTTVWHAYDNVYSTHVYAGRAVEIIKSHDQSQPLYLYLPFQSVHDPLQVPKKFEDMYSYIHDDKRRVYCGMVSALDEAFGQVMQALEQTRMADNMLLVFTTDNGGPTYQGANNWPLRGAKTTTWEGGTRGSAFVYSKNLLNKTGYVNNEMMHAVDWFPTILEMAGIKPEPGIDGISQVQTIVNGAATKRTEFVYNIDDVENRTAIRYGDYKLIQGGAGRFNGWYPPPKLDAPYPEIVTDNVDRKHEYVVFNEIGQSSYGDYKLNQEVAVDNLDRKHEYMLFNVKDDPTEHFDLSEKEPVVLEQLKKRLSEWMKSMVPAMNPPNDPKSNPANFNGSWSPGWC